MRLLSVLGIALLSGLGCSKQPKTQVTSLPGHNFRSECFATSSKTSLRMSYIYADSTETELVEFFDDNACSSVAFRSTVKSHFEIGTAREDVAPEAFEFRRVYESETAVAYTTSEIDTFNRVVYCGVNHWKSGEERDVTGCSERLGEVESNVFAVRDNSLYFGVDKAEAPEPTTRKGKKVVVEPVEEEPVILFDSPYRVDLNTPNVR